MANLVIKNKNNNNSSLTFDINSGTDWQIKDDNGTLKIGTLDSENTLTSKFSINNGNGDAVLGGGIFTLTNKTENGKSKVSVENGSGKVSLYTATNRGIWDDIKGQWVINVTTNGDNTYIKNWIDKGSTTKPVYFSSSGEPTEGSTYAGGTAVTLNGTSKSATTASFYAPTGAGTEGYILKSNGSGAPTWLQTLPVKNGGTGKTTHTSNSVLIGNGTDVVKNVATASGAFYATAANGVAQFGTLPVAQGGTGATSFTSGQALIGAGTGAVTTRAITNNTSKTAVTASTNLITANTLYYHSGNSNLTTVGTITSGTWNASTIGISYGGTGATTRSTAMNNLMYIEPPTKTTDTGVFWSDAGYGLAYSNDSNTMTKPSGVDYLWVQNIVLQDYNLIRQLGFAGGSNSIYTRKGNKTDGMGEWYKLLTTAATVTVAQGGTGATTFTSGQALIGAGTGAITTRAITNNTSATAVSASTNLITANTLYYHKGNSNIVTVGTITSGTWHGSTIGVSYGGTGKTTNTENAVLTGNGTSAIKNVATASGAFYATAANGAAKFGTLPIAQGGTGATTANGAQKNLLGDSPAGTSDMASTTRIACLRVTPTASDGAIYYRTVSEFDDRYNSKYLKLTGGTLSDTLTINAGASVASIVRCTDGTNKLSLQVSSSDNRGIYDDNGGQWMIYRPAAAADTATDAAKIAAKTTRLQGGVAFTGAHGTDAPGSSTPGYGVTGAVYFKHA